MPFTLTGRVRQPYTDSRVAVSSQTADGATLQVDCKLQTSSSGFKLQGLAHGEPWRVLFGEKEGAPASAALGIYSWGGGPTNR